LIVESRFKDYLSLPAWIGLSFVAAAIGAWVNTTAIQTWYTTIQKPDWLPPNWAFPVVWTLLYVLMGVAAWLVWRERRKARVMLPLLLFVLQLILNAGWSIIFFGFRQFGWAFAEIVLLWGAIAATTILFYKTKPWAGYLMVPYLLWVTFAAALNAAIWVLN
jgi:tryptophan-rich sensory protein